MKQELKEVEEESATTETLQQLMEANPQLYTQYAELLGRTIVKLGVRYALPACGATFVLGMLIGYLIHH